MYIKTIKQLISNIKSKQSKIYFTLKIKNILNEIDVDILSAILFKLVCLFSYWPVCITDIDKIMVTHLICITFVQVIPNNSILICMCNTCHNYLLKNAEEIQRNK